MTQHVYYILTFTGSVKIYQVIIAITSIVLVTVVDYDLNSNCPTVRPHAFLMTMVCSSFFLSRLVIFMSFVMAIPDVPCSIFYLEHGVLATVGFIVLGLTNISQENHSSPANTGLFVSALCVPNSPMFFADTVIAYEQPPDRALGVESK